MKTKTLSLFLVLLLSACSVFHKKGPALRDISNREISFVYSKTDTNFRPLLGKDLIYYFYEDLTYQSKLNGKRISAGNYAYNRTGPYSAELSLSYTDGVDVDDLVLHLYYESENKGTFEAIPYSIHNTDEAGNFMIHEKSKEPAKI